jgi:hypothetical protein
VQYDDSAIVSCDSARVPFVILDSAKAGSNGLLNLVRDGSARDEIYIIDRRPL